jgi:hypothetical protein
MDRIKREHADMQSLLLSLWKAKENSIEYWIKNDSED